MFQGRKLLIVTKHHKEKVIAPILERELGVSCFVSSNIDTDQFGTFTGSVERKDSPLVTVKNKCLLGMELENCDLAVASEGSFGPHPSIYFAPADDEYLLLIDKKNQIEIVVRALSLSTNFYAAELDSDKALAAFCEKVKFPSHGLIIKKAKDSLEDVVKDINDYQTLERIYRDYLDKFGKVYLETDMRAMYNPTRMEVIEQATIKLVNKINSCCPACATPGFDVTNTIQGLPCALCGSPTQSTLYAVRSCVQCNYTDQVQYPNGKMTEEPLYCDYCNP